jgi:hypothetical protein
MPTKEEIAAAEQFVEKSYDGDFRKIATPTICAFITNAIAHIREQDAKLQRLRDGIAVREEALRQFTQTMEEQEAALAEAREFVELTATLTPCTPNQYMRAQTWVKVYDAAHPALKETP